MNLQQANIILKKINRLYESMILDSKIDVHEQKLMLSYIQQLHTSFSDDDSVIPVAPVKKVVFAKPPVVNTPSPKVIKAPAPIKEEVVTPPPAKVVVPPPAPIVVEKPRVLASTPPPPAAEASSSKPSVPEDIAALFDSQANPKELSEKLAAQPIRDLTKSMGLNEKFLTRDELFGKDNEAFNAALTKLNSFKNFEDASIFLAELAIKYGWTKKGKKKKAQIFIKLVRRRYN